MVLNNLNLFANNFQIKYKESNKIRKISELLVSSIIYVFIFLLTVIFLKEWWDGTNFSFNSYKTDLGTRNSSNHNITFTSIYPVFVFKFFNEDDKEIYLQDNRDEIVDFSASLLLNNGKIKDIIFKSCKELKPKQYDISPYNYDYITRSLHKPLCMLNLESEDILMYNDNLYRDSLGYNFILELYFNDDNPKIKDIAYVQTEIYLNTNPLILSGDIQILQKDITYQRTSFYSISPYINKTEDHIDIGLTNFVETIYRKTKFISNSNKLLDNINIKEYFKQETRIKYSRIENSFSRGLFILLITLDPEIEDLKFRNMKILDVFSRIGGIIKFLGFFIKLIRYFFKKSIISSLVEEFNSDNEIIYDSNKNINKNNKEFFEVTNKKRDKRDENLIINESNNNPLTSSELLIDNQENKNSQLNIINSFDSSPNVKIKMLSKCSRLCCCFKKSTTEVDNENANVETKLHTNSNKFNREKITQLLDIRNVLRCLLVIENISIESTARTFYSTNIRENKAYNHDLPKNIKDLSLDNQEKNGKNNKSNQSNT